MRRGSSCTRGPRPRSGWGNVPTSAGRSASCISRYYDRKPCGTSHPRDDPARERLGHAPFLVDADGEHQFLKSVALELADLLDQRVGGADQAGGADEAVVDQLGFPWMQIGVVARACGNAGAR